MLFSDLPLDRRLQKILEEKKFSDVTAVQQQAIPHGLMGKDLLVSSKTGSGKTLAFLIPALQKVLTQKSLSKRDARVLVLAPTRELAKQVFNELLPFTKPTGLKAALLVGGENYNDQAKVLSKNPAFVVGTPGRVTDHLFGRSLFLNGLELLIFDEADRMLDLGFKAQLTAINKAADHRKRQTLMFSATLHSALINDFTGELQKKPYKIDIDASDQANEDIQQNFIFADNVDHKDNLLDALLKQETFEQVIIFSATREDTGRLASLCEKWGFKSAALSGDLLQSQRASIMQSFASKQQQILVTTDVASRGLDIPTVSLVVNFDLPKTADEYIHRIGRTGRSGNIGHAFSLIGPRDWNSFEKLKAQLKQDFAFTQLEGLSATFSGKKPPESPWKRKARTTAKKDDQSLEKPTKKTVRVKTMEGKDVGDAPIMRRKKPLPPEPEQDDIDDIDEEI
ncbi:DEAD/DEAH box helicase [Alteromonas sp. a30]|uniref:DEAD/DEAH box helicase n=1 Tax=Alteromonas sp. a30 TaxID=2730917 RepID=UPI0022803CFE|nr:DEAD/DEAH box helicase [Alteromonas sp. a30]MCY7296972.1 DEAD/DEAH box helicase [Alteromonas sp. a30]